MVFRLIRWRCCRRRVRERGINGMHIVSTNASPKRQFFYAARLIDCTPPHPAYSIPLREHTYTRVHPLTTATPKERLANQSTFLSIEYMFVCVNNPHEHCRHCEPGETNTHKYLVEVFPILTDDCQTVSNLYTWRTWLTKIIQRLKKLQPPYKQWL